MIRTIGLVGGMSWESTAEYYRIINESVRDRLGGTHSARLVLHSVDFHEIEQFQHNSQWNQATAAMIDAGRSVELGGSARHTVHNGERLLSGSSQGPTRNRSMRN